MKNIKTKSIFIFTLLSITVIAQSTVVRFETDYGNIDIEMREDAAPLTVDNFLEYVNSGLYDESIFHRTDAGGNSIKFVQGGEFYVRNDSVESIPAGDTVDNEFSLSNFRGTISMAKLSGQPNSASKSYFFNLANNSSLFDSENGGYTVFGEVISGIEILDIIGSLRTITGTPLIGYIPQTLAQLDDYLYINKAFVLSEQFQINPGLSGAWFNPATNGQGIYLEVLPSVDTLIMAWFAFDTEQPDAAVPSTIGDAGNRWLTASGNFQGNQFVGSVFKTSGGIFDNPTSVSNTEIGDVIITFTNCGLAEMSYFLDDSGLSNTINIQRISGSNIDFCELLSNQADQGVLTQ